MPNLTASIRDKPAALLAYFDTLSRSDSANSAVSQQTGINASTTASRIRGCSHQADNHFSFRYVLPVVRRLPRSRTPGKVICGATTPGPFNGALTSFRYATRWPTRADFGERRDQALARGRERLPSAVGSRSQITHPELRSAGWADCSAIRRSGIAESVSVHTGWCSTPDCRHLPGIAVIDTSANYDDRRRHHAALQMS